MLKQTNGLESTCMSLKKVSECFRKLTKALNSFNTVALYCCPNKKVVHLAKYSKKRRIRKKNKARAYKIINSQSQE